MFKFFKNRDSEDKETRDSCKIWCLDWCEENHYWSTFIKSWYMRPLTVNFMILVFKLNQYVKIMIKSIQKKILKKTMIKLNLIKM